MRLVGWFDAAVGVGLARLVLFTAELVGGGAVNAAVRAGGQKIQVDGVAGKAKVRKVDEVGYAA